MRFFPRSLTGQTILLMSVMLAITQVLNVTLLVGERRLVPRHSFYLESINIFPRVLRNLPDYSTLELPHYQRASDLASPTRGIIVIGRRNEADRRPGSVHLPRYEKLLRERLEKAGYEAIAVTAYRRPVTSPREGRSPPLSSIDGRPMIPDPDGPHAEGMEELILSVQPEPGIWINYQMPHYPTDNVLRRALISTGLTFLIAVIACVVLAKWITRPMRELAVAAEQFGRGTTVDKVSENGPDDLRVAARAFNDMQDRLARLIESQRSTLRAISHDLRTPITSLRIRAESLPEEHDRDRIVSTLDHMAVMTQEILNWTEDFSMIEAPATIDLGSLIDSVARDYAENGLTVSSSCPEGKIPLECRQGALRRALNNLVDNALKYAGSAVISCEAEGRDVLVHVEDSGEGIPEYRMAEAMQPFMRLEKSRNSQTGGIGLGLSITRSILEAQGGSLTLQNRPEGGLKATMRLPAARIASSGSAG